MTDAETQPTPDTPTPDAQPDRSPPAPWTPQRRKAWYTGLLIALLLLAATGWLLARLIWLPYYFGLFFYLVAGLLIGSVAFRSARPARPMSGRRILTGILLVAILSVAAAAIWEYEYVVRTIGDPPRFNDLRNAAVQRDDDVRDVARQVQRAFRNAVADAYPPGGVIGYARWAIDRGELSLTVDGQQERLSIDQTGPAWAIRTLVAVALLAAGLWSSLESLRAGSPVTNTLLPGEEYEEDDDA